MAEVEKLHGLHHTGLTMNQRFTILAQATVGRRGRGRGKRNPFLPRTRSQTNTALIEAIANQLEYQAQRPVRGMQTRSRGRGRGGLRRYGSEGSLHGMPGLRRTRSNSYGDMNHNGFNKEQRWRRSNGNISNRSSHNGSLYSSAGSVKSGQGFWLRGVAKPERGMQRGRGVRGRGRGRGFRGRAHQGRVNRVNDVTVGRVRPARGVGRRGMRRNNDGAGPPGAARGVYRGRGRGRGRGISRNQTPKPIPTKEELDAQLEQYMSGTKAALDKELDEYMRHAMDFD